MASLQEAKQEHARSNALSRDGCAENGESEVPTHDPEDAAPPAVPGSAPPPVPATLEEDPELERVHAYRPRPSVARLPPYKKPHGSFVEHGKDQLQEFILEALGRLDDATKADMLSAPPSHIEIGTACSGTDVAVLAGKAFSKAWAQFSGKLCITHHVFSCEADEKKQEFLKRMFTETEDNNDMSILLGNTQDLVSDSEPFDLLSEANLEGLPMVSDLMVGFPCQDVSRLNPSAEEARWIIKDAGRRTGSVFGHVATYSERLLRDPDGRKGFRGLLLENVLGLLTAPKGTDNTGNPWHSNLDYCSLRMHQAGLLLLPFVLDPQMFGVPVSRQRVWMITGLSEDDIRQMAHDMADRLCDAHSCRDLRDFLLEPDHELVLRQIEASKCARLKSEEKLKMNVSKPKQPQAKVKSAPKWADQHRRAMEKSGRDWWVPSYPDESVFAQHPGLYALTERQFDYCSVLDIKFPDDRIATIELSQNLRSGKDKGIKGNHADIVTPNGQQLVIHQARCLTGFETLLLQGIHFGVLQDRLEQFDDSLLRSLGGNAFQAHCLAVMFVIKQALQSRLETHANMERRKREIERLPLKKKNSDL